MVEPSFASNDEHTVFADYVISLSWGVVVVDYALKLHGYAGVML